MSGTPEPHADLVGPPSRRPLRPAPTRGWDLPWTDPRTKNSPRPVLDEGSLGVILLTWGLESLDGRWVVSLDQYPGHSGRCPLKSGTCPGVRGVGSPLTRVEGELPLRGRP